MERALRSLLPGGKFGNVSKKRSELMRAVKGQGNKSTEVAFRLALVRSGFRHWVVRPRYLPYKPDFFFPSYSLAIFVDGCYWHGCRQCGHFPRTNSAFWKSKITKNRERDRQAKVELKKYGIRVLRIWEHSLKSSEDLSAILARLRTWVDPSCTGSRSYVTRQSEGTGLSTAE